MAATARRGITASLLFLSAAWSTSAAADPLESTAARVPPRIEIDPAAISIDVAAQRRLLDSSIRRALEVEASARPVAEEPKLAKSDALPPG